MKSSMDTVNWAFEQSSKLLEPLEQRWIHVQGVVKKAYHISEIFEEQHDKIILIASAYLHDIGYSPMINKTGFHPLDGANYLRSQKQTRLASLVAHHSGAIFEASLRGFEVELSEFKQEHSSIADALTYCDMTTNSKGLQVTFEERLNDIFSRYNEKHIVNKAIRQAVPTLSAAIERTERLIYKYGLVL